MTRAPVQDLLDAMSARPETAELQAGMMIQAELVGTIDFFDEAPKARAERWKNIALYARLMADHASWLARQAQLTPLARS